MTTPTLDLIVAWQDHLRLTGASGYTLESWGHVLQRCHDQLPHGLDAANGSDLAHWLANAAWSPSTRASYRSALVNFYRWACDPADPWLRTDPTDHLPRVRRRRTPPKPSSNDELARILTGAEEPYRLWYLLAAYAGARCIEVERLRRDDITDRAVYLHGKGDKRRAVPTHEYVWDAARLLPAGPVTDQTARQISRNACRHMHHVLRMPGMSMHRLRHWYLTNILWTSDLRTAQDLAGHESPDTTAIYTQVSDRQRWEAVSLLPRLAAEPGQSAGAVAHSPGPGR